MATVEKLPEELMTLILSKLPAKSLLRFKSVQKSWYSLISSPYFVHLHRSSTKKPDCFVVRRPHLKRNVLSFSSYETLEDLGNQINIPVIRYGAELCGSCDGLVCVTNYGIGQMILICNPTIRELRSLPLPLGNNTSGYHIDSVAFGSDPCTGQYTVVVIGVPFKGDREARLYDFSTDSWRKTAVVFSPGPFLFSRRAVSFNGAFHWSPWDRGSDILAFHMSNEVTELIPLPDFADVSRSRKLCVSSKSQLSLILYDYYFGGRFEICVMTEYGVKESWTMLFNIGPLPKFLRPIAFWDEQWRLLLKSGAQELLVSCDLQDHQNLRHFPIDGDFDLSPCSRSLVSVNGIGKSII